MQRNIRKEGVFRQLWTNVTATIFEAFTEPLYLIHLISKLFGRKAKECSVKFHRPSQLCKNLVVTVVIVKVGTHL